MVQQQQTSVCEEAVIMMCLKETQQDCQNGHDHEDGEGNVGQVRQGFLQGVRHHGNAGLDVPAKEISFISGIDFIRN